MLQCVDICAIIYARDGSTRIFPLAEVWLTMNVIMQRISLNNRWRSCQWRPLEVLDEMTAPGLAAHCLLDDPDDTRWLFPGFDIDLFPDEAEGYFLNASSPVPCWFIMWRLEKIGDAEVAVPKMVTLSYNEAARMMDGGEQVDTLPASREIIDWLGQFIQRHYRPEVKKKHKKPSFEGGSGVEEMAHAEGKSNGG